MASVFRRLPLQHALLARPLGCASAEKPAAFAYALTKPTRISLNAHTAAPRRRFLASRTSRESPSQVKQDDVPVEAEEGAKIKPLSDEAQHAKARHNQIQRPWHREGASRPPAEKEPATQSEAHAKGKLLTTPNRLLKIILPLPIGTQKNQGGSEAGKDSKSNECENLDASRKGHIEPLSFFLHPQQPISYVQRLIQAELPPVIDDKGRERAPNVYFWAENTGSEQDVSHNGRGSGGDGGGDGGHRGPGSHVAAYSGQGHEAAERADADKDWVRWGSSTEIGDFIREAARGREFAIRIEQDGSAGASAGDKGRGGGYTETRVTVPSFGDRTYYQRMRLRRLSRQIEELAAIKHDCDALAHRSARRLAKGGFVGLLGWWGVVYYLTFRTEFGWDLVEPVTYLVGLSAIMGGYLWFLFVSRDLSYKAALNVTVSRQQTSLYESRGFDVRRWERLVDEANALRTEIRRVAYEYDVDWDETQDLGGEKVKKVLEKEDKKGKARKEDDEAVAAKEEAEAKEEEDEEAEEAKEEAAKETEESEKGGRRKQ